MKKNIMPIQGKATSNCLFFTLSTLFHYYDRNVNFHNACLWNFIFVNSETKLLGECIFEDDLYTEKYSYIRSVSGIFFHRNDKNDLSLINAYLSDEKPVLVHFDSFWCSWNANYMKHHYDHFFIINKYNRQEDSYECIDSFYLDAPIWMSGKKLKQGIMDIIDYDVFENPSYKQAYPIMLQELKNNISKGRDSPMFCNMLMFAKAVQNIDYTAEFGGHTDVNTIPLFIKVQNISLDRIALSKLCQNIYVENNIMFFQEISLRFYILYKEWNMLLVMLMKYFITRDERILCNSSSQIKKITELERYIAFNINKKDY